MPLPPRRRLRAPQEDGAALIDPPLSEIPALIAVNQAIGREFDRKAGFSADFRARARGGLLLRSPIRDNNPPPNLDSARPTIVSGHQPELFHPGVWFKNFVLSSIAQHLGGAGINLLIDNDAVKSTSIRVPTLEGAVPQVVEVPFDGPARDVIWEGRWICDSAIFESFPSRVASVFGALANKSRFPSGPLVHRIWPAAVEHATQSIRSVTDSIRKLEREGITDASSRFPPVANLGESLAAGRHQMEREFGLHTHEYPLSALANSELLEFLIFLVERHREFQFVHNSVLAEYRFSAGIRGEGRPVPDLAEHNGWIESPLWNLRTSNANRKRLFVRELRGGWEITDGSGPNFSSAASDSSEALGIRLLKAGFHLRPRALVTTMYARLVLSDLFIHGIGGAKYDEVTDEIIRRFFGIEPPRYVTATATFRLPIDRPLVTIEDVRENVVRLRDVRYRPESFVRDPLLAAEPELKRQLVALAAEKKEYVQRHALRRGSEEAFRGVEKLNRAMHRLLAAVEQHLQRERAQLAEDLRIAGLLGSREFSFVLYPEEYLVQRLLELSRLPA